MSTVRRDATIFLVLCLILVACDAPGPESFESRQALLTGIGTGAGGLVVVGGGGTGGAIGTGGPKAGSLPPAAHADDKVDGRWFAQLPGGFSVCPPPANGAFTAPAHLFGEGPLAPDLAVFCVYQHAHADDPDDPPTFVAGPGAPVAVGRDRSLISSLAAAVSVPLIGAELRAATLERAGISGATTSALAPLARTATRVAVVDSTGDGVPGRAGSPAGHGRDVGRIIREISCPLDVPGPGCFSHVGNDAALRYDASGSPVATGGQFGSLGDLAQAIDRAVVDWDADPAHPHLILNLSLGWVGDPSADDPVSPASVDARAVLAALRRATCAGALTIAAAGNETRASAGGPLYPAAWQSTSTSPSLCAGLLTASEKSRVAGDPALAFQTAQPPVWAVGDVDAAGEPLFNHRAGARPPLVAYGYAASVADDPLATSYTEEITGTSASAAVVSGIAAVLWALEPRRSPRQIIDGIHDSGAPVNATAADFCEGPSCSARPVRRALLCGALSQTSTCLLPGLFCRPLVSCEGTALQGRPNVRIPAGSLSAAEGYLPPVSIAVPLRVLRPLPSIPTIPGGLVPSLPAPPDAVTAPWIWPQPEPVHCSPCFIGSDQGQLAFFMNLTSAIGVSGIRLQIDGRSYPIAINTTGALVASPPPAYVVTGIGATQPQQATLTIGKNGVESTQAVLISN